MEAPRARTARRRARQAGERGEAAAGGQPTGCTAGERRSALLDAFGTDPGPSPSLALTPSLSPGLTLVRASAQLHSTNPNQAGARPRAPISRGHHRRLPVVRRAQRRAGEGVPRDLRRRPQGGDADPLRHLRHEAARDRHRREGGGAAGDGAQIRLRRARHALAQVARASPSPEPSTGRNLEGASPSLMQLRP